MGKTHEPNISIMRDGPQEGLGKKSWRFAIAHLVSLAAIVTGLLILPSAAMAIDRLTDKEVQELFANIEKDRSAFEAALDVQLKNAVIRGPKGEVNTNEFFDDLQDQVTRTTERFKPDYSASSEVLALLQYSSRLDAWVKKQKSGFQGSTEWTPFAADLSRLAAAYNTTFPIPANGIARRLNDAELVAAAAEVEKLCDPFRSALDASLSANKSVTPEAKASNLQQVDGLKSAAHALNEKLGANDKGVAEAGALIKQALLVIQMNSKLKLSSDAMAAWSPLRAQLGKVAWAYEVNDKNLPYQ
jgi:hypothetical protein